MNLFRSRSLLHGRADRLGGERCIGSLPGIGVRCNRHWRQTRLDYWRDVGICVMSRLRDLEMGSYRWVAHLRGWWHVILYPSGNRGDFSSRRNVSSNHTSRGWCTIWIYRRRISSNCGLIICCTALLLTNPGGDRRIDDRLRIDVGNSEWIQTRVLSANERTRPGPCLDFLDDCVEAFSSDAFRCANFVSELGPSQASM